MALKRVFQVLTIAFFLWITQVWIFHTDASPIKGPRFCKQTLTVNDFQEAMKPFKKDGQFLLLIALYQCDLQRHTMYSIASAAPDILLLSNCTLEPTELKDIGNAKNLKKLYLTDSPMVDKDLLFLKQLNNLEFLDVSNTKVNGEFLSFIPHPEKVKELVMNGSALTASNIDLLKRFSNLLFLDVRDTPPDPSCYGVLSKLKSLETVSASVEKESDRWFRQLSRIENLKGNIYETTTLDFQDCPLTDKGMDTPFKSQRIKELRLARTKISDKGLPSLRNMKELYSLILDDTAVKGDGLKVLRDLHLANLSMSDCKLSASGIDAICGLKSLRYLNLSNARLPPAQARLSAIGATTVNWLCLSGVYPSLNNLKNILKSESLKTLDLSGTEVSDELVTAIQSSRSLEELTLISSSGLTSKRLAKLMSIPSMRLIRFNNSHLTSLEIRELIKSNPKVELSPNAIPY